MSKNNKTCVDIALLVTKQPQDKFICSICLQFMTRPFETDCQMQAKHVFGLSCISEWIGKKQGVRQCPLCRSKFDKLTHAYELQAEASKLQGKCPSCEIILPITQVQSHLSSCETYLQVKRESLGKVVEEQILWLQKEINPHLRQSHEQIYTTYVKEWKWLYDDTRNWKWWWWCSNPWWENKSCPTCNELWHKYENEIDALENRRIEILNDLGVEAKSQNVGLEKVQCENQ